MVISPGVPINHPVAVKAKSLGKRIIGEFELGYESFTPTFIGVTGTNGKTTTVSLIDAILKEAGKNAKPVGNVGVPLTSELEDCGKDTVFVAEVSSFQLESVSEFHPYISCVLNISPDHLERHYSMENYIFLKKRIFANQRESDYCLLNYDDETVRSFYPDVKAKVVWVSCEEEVDGAYLKDGALYFKGEKITEAANIPLVGGHNIYNALFAAAVSKLLGADTAAIAKAISSFKGVPYRTQLVAEINGVKFICSRGFLPPRYSIFVFWMGSIIRCGISFTSCPMPARCLVAFSSSAALHPSRGDVFAVMMVPFSSSMAAAVCSVSSCLACAATVTRR